MTSFPRSPSAWVEPQNSEHFVVELLLLKLMLLSVNNMHNRRKGT